MLEFRILGPLEVANEEGPLRLGGTRQRATLAIMLLNANRVVPIDSLAEDLYAGAPPVTAVTQVQRQVSDLRKTLGAEVIETRPPGYLMHVLPGQLDLEEFERLAAEATSAAASGSLDASAALLGEALAMWRGRPFADLANEEFAKGEIARLEEVRLAALEQRLEVELALGRHASIVSELEALVRAHPLREPFRRQLMLALYRGGRQTEALEVYRETRRLLVDELGIEPSRPLQDLERAVLAHDPALELTGFQPAPAKTERSVLVASTSDRLDALVALARPLGTLPDRELIVVRLVLDEGDLESGARILNELRESLPGARTATFTTTAPADEVLRFSRVYDVDLMLVGPPVDFPDAVSEELTTILANCPADVGVVAGAPARLAPEARVFVLFGGNDHDWAALELAASVCSATRAPLTLIGTKAIPPARPDASRLLADASIAVQRLAGIETEPLLVEQREDAVVAAVEGKGLVVTGISPGWRREGIDAIRRALLTPAQTPVVLVHRGRRPSSLAPQSSRTRFTWTLEAGS